VIVIYPPQQTLPVTSVIREYDQFGQENRDQFGQENRPTGGSSVPGSPTFLIALNDHTIRAAAQYWVVGKTLHYVTLEREERQVPLDTVDRTLSEALNRERQVPFSLQAQ
jgi:hypothetical protein